MDFYENQDYPFDMLVENLSINMDKSRNPLFDTMLILHNELDSIGSLKFGKLDMANYPIAHQTSKLDFKLDIYNDSTTGNLNCILEYNTELFRKESMLRLAEHYLNILEEVVDKPTVKLSEIDMLRNNFV